MTDSFDFVVGDPFREALNSDYREMLASLQHGAYKATVVLAGSIVEAILIDYLVALGHKDKTGKDPLSLTFADLVAACRTQEILSSRTADLCSAVRSFRNLIHPGRSVRLSDSVDEASASVAKDLVRIVATEVAKKRRASYGLTAEQLVSKIEKDGSSLAILSHLMPELSAQEKERLLLTVIPHKYLTLQEAANDWEGFDYYFHRERLISCYRQVLSVVPEDLRRTVARQFVRIIKEESAEYIREYGDGFFRGTDIALLADNEASLVRAHLLDTIGDNLSSRRIAVLAGIEATISPAELDRWIDPLLRFIMSEAHSDDSRAEMRTYFVSGFSKMGSDTQGALLSRLNVWKAHFEKHSEEGNLETLRDLESELLAALL